MIKPKRPRTEAQKRAFEKARAAQGTANDRAREFCEQLREETAWEWARSGHLSDDPGNPYDG